MIKDMLKKESVKILLCALLISLASSSATYFMVISKIPRFATVDLLYLHNNFLMNISKHKIDQGITDEEVAKMIVNYSASIEPLLQRISREGNIILFQKQALVTKADDITPNVAKALIKNANINEK